MSDSKSTRQETLERGGSISRGAIIPHEALDLPDGTEVWMRIEVLWRAPERKARDASGSAAISLTDEQLHEWALRNPPPQAWWDATDNPSEPEPERDKDAGHT